jgi:hypothetical protein
VNPEPPSGGEALTVCYVPYFLPFLQLATHSVNTIFLKNILENLLSNVKIYYKINFIGYVA